VTRSDYWRRLLAANPKLATCAARFSPAQIKRFVEQVWDAAYQAGRDEGISEAAVAEFFGRFGKGGKQ